MNIPQRRNADGRTQRLVVALLMAALLVPAASNVIAGTHPTGAIAPVFKLPGTTGDVSLGDYRGKVVLVDFWASWCGPCRQSFPWMSTMLDRYSSKGLVIVAINLDKRRDLAEKFLADYPAPFVVAFDPLGMSAEAFHVEAMPTSFLIDRDGRVIYSHAGFQQPQATIVEDEIKEALSK